MIANRLLDIDTTSKILGVFDYWDKHRKVLSLTMTLSEIIDHLNYIKEVRNEPKFED